LGVFGDVIMAEFDELRVSSVLRAAIRVSRVSGSIFDEDRPSINWDQI